jgi:MFS superfamily sulfate permease-like transporter
MTGFFLAILPVISTFSVVVAGIIAVLYGNLKNAYYFHKKEHKEGEIIHVRLSEQILFLNKASIKLTLHHLPENSMVQTDATGSHYIDFNVPELNWEFNDVKALLKNMTSVRKGFQPKYKIMNTHNVQSEAVNFDINKQPEESLKELLSVR